MRMAYRWRARTRPSRIIPRSWLDPSTEYELELVRVADVADALFEAITRGAHSGHDSFVSDS